MALDEIKNFVAVSDRLGTAGQPSEEQLREVADAGFEVVVNLGLLDPRYCLADEADSVAALGLAVVNPDRCADALRAHPPQGLLDRSNFPFVGTGLPELPALGTVQRNVVAKPL